MTFFKSVAAIAACAAVAVDAAVVRRDYSNKTLVDSVKVLPCSVLIIANEKPEIAT